MSYAILSEQPLFSRLLQFYALYSFYFSRNLLLCITLKYKREGFSVAASSRGSTDNSSVEPIL